MKESQEIVLEERALVWATVLYGMLVLTAFLIGLYGLFTLLWLAGNTIERGSYIMSAIM